MKTLIKAALFVIPLTVLTVFFSRSLLLGTMLEPILEKTLTDLFDMPVTVENLRVDPLSGRVHASRITFRNAAPFALKPHLDVYGIHFDIDFPALRRNEVLIETLTFDRFFYFIDRISTPEGTTNNISTWYHHMKNGNQGGKQEKKGGGRPWKVVIRHFLLHDGTFIFHDRHNRENEKKYVFQKLEGRLDGFEWPTPDPANFNEKVRMRGTFGEFYPAPFVIKGTANFATSQVGFDLKGLIENGNLLEHEDLWKGLPLDLQSGSFRLEAKVVCLRRDLQSRNRLLLKSVKVTQHKNASDMIWGMPLLASIAFLEDQKVISLNVPVHGHISDPKFEMQKAFREAFQNSLERWTRAGIGGLAKSPVILVSQTSDWVQGAQEKLSESLEKISAAVQNGKTNGKNLSGEMR